MPNEEKTLSDSELEALRDVAAPDESAAEAAVAAAKVEVVSYNFRQPGRLSGSQLRALKVVHEFFAKRLSEARPNGHNVSYELGLLSVETVSYSNFMGSLTNPCFMALLSTGFEPAVLMEVDLPVVNLMVSRILGDDEGEPEAKALTSIEQAIAGNWIESLLPMLSESWKMSAVVEFGLKSIECDPRFVQVMPDDNPVVSLTFRLKAGNVNGRLAICYPLEPLQELLEGMSLRMSGGSDEDGGKEQGGERILASLKRVPFELRSELGRSSISASQLASLRKGDVLCLDRSIHDSVDVFLGDTLIFEATLGRKGDNFALQLGKRCPAN